TLFQKPTVAELTDHVRGKTQVDTNCLIPFQSGDGTRPPLFLIHPQGGGVLSYFHLARSLGADESVYALQSVGYESDELVLSTIEEMAERYLSEIKRVAPQGPYRLAGWSFGGIVAYEMVRQLERMGEAVDFLGLIDVMTTDRFQADLTEEPLTERMALEQYAELLDLDVSAHTKLEDEQLFTLVLRRAKEINWFPDGTTPEMMRRKILVMMHNGIAISNYRSVETIRSDIHVFHVTERATKLQHPLIDPEDWCRFTQGQVHAIAIPGDHHSLVNPPHVEGLANAFRQVLQPNKTESMTR
ncbi:MAG: thioesterase domain-containing protein, partial [Tumebacillaceae bacterium]